MFEAMITAAMGVRGQQQRLDTIADNVSNINTTGFKASRLNFKDALNVAGGYPYADETQNQQKGHGVLTTSVSRVFTGGILTVSDRQFDFAIEGDGFFEIMGSDGVLYYTRAGNFYITPMDGQQYLVTGDGHFVLDDNSSPIIVPNDARTVSVDTNGQITYNFDDEYTEDGGRLAIRGFVNNDGLSALGGCNYVPTAASGEVQNAENYTLRQGALENSNVDLSREMTRLIRTQRAFSFASRALTTADDMEGIANNLRR